MKNDNPFVLNFGVKPDNYISRIDQSTEIINAFENAKSINSYVIMGVRGSGKTVLLSHIRKEFVIKNDWIVVELIPELDMLEQLASQLYDSSKVKSLFAKKKVGISFHGVSFSIEEGKPVANVISVIEMMLKKIKESNKRVLICVDEVVKNENMKAFAQTFQLLLRNEYPAYLLMTGLYQNVYELENDKSLTFLLRTPKVVISPLNQFAISASYSKIFNIEPMVANTLAKFTKGYAFAYQVLGYILWEEGETKLSDQIINKFDSYMFEYVYEKIWSELSNKDKQVFMGFTKDEPTNVSEVALATGMDTKTISVYRNRLIKRGLLSDDGYGIISPKLPRFVSFIKQRAIFG